MKNAYLPQIDEQDVQKVSDELGRDVGFREAEQYVSWKKTITSEFGTQEMGKYVESRILEVSRYLADPKLNDDSQIAIYRAELDFCFRLKAILSMLTQNKQYAARQVARARVK